MWRTNSSLMTMVAILQASIIFPVEIFLHPTRPSSTPILSPAPSTQAGAAPIVTDKIWINGNAIYQLSGGTVTVPNIVLTGSLNYPPQVFVYNAPPFAVTNENISSTGGAIVIENSAQQFGRLTIASDSGINLA